MGSLYPDLAIDHLTDGSRSIAPFSKAECEELLGILYRAKGLYNTLPS